MSMIEKLMHRKQPRQRMEYDTFDDDMYDYSDVEPDNSRWELETSDILNNYEHALRGERMDSKGRWYQPDKSKPKLNEVGVFDTISDIKSIMHKGVFLGNVTKDYAVEETKAEARAYMKKLLMNLDYWEVDKAQFESLVLQYARWVNLALTRPMNDMERKHRNKRMQIRENYSHDEVRPDEIKL